MSIQAKTQSSQRYLQIMHVFTGAHVSQDFASFTNTLLLPPRIAKARWEKTATLFLRFLAEPNTQFPELQSTTGGHIALVTNTKSHSGLCNHRNARQDHAAVAGRLHKKINGAMVDERRTHVHMQETK